MPLPTTQRCPNYCRGSTNELEIIFDISFSLSIVLSSQQHQLDNIKSNEVNKVIHHSQFTKFELLQSRLLLERINFQRQSRYVIQNKIIDIYNMHNSKPSMQFNLCCLNVCKGNRMCHDIGIEIFKITTEIFRAGAIFMPTNIIDRTYQLTVVNLVDFELSPNYFSIRCPIVPFVTHGHFSASSGMNESNESKWWWEWKWLAH